ncbi:hypothetical protein ACFX2J_007454 [Malus domestica]|uniref:Uncharacterized protein n=1 Tax=Malus domestica TaxID=3750 RepID=A0A498IM45_MALDO|nr:hypothetical protein DVH24_003550 [Malus domestica]
MKEEANSPEAFGGSFQRRKEVEGDKNMALSNSNDRWELLESGLIDKNMALKNSNDHWAFLEEYNQRGSHIRSHLNVCGF